MFHTFNPNHHYSSSKSAGPPKNVKCIVWSCAKLVIRRRTSILLHALLIELSNWKSCFFTWNGIIKEPFKHLQLFLHIHISLACMEQSETIQRLDHLFRDCLRLLAVFLRRWSTVIGYELGLIRLIALPPAFPCQPPRPAFYRGSKIFPHLRTSITSTIVVSLKSDSKRT